MKNEVRALEQAACSLVAKLDILLITETGTRLLYANNGLHIITPDHLGEPVENAFVTILPVGWPESSYINARFLREHKEWRLHEGGEIQASHLPIPICALGFKPSDNGIGIRFDLRHEEYQGQLVRSGYAKVIASLQQDAAA